MLRPIDLIHVETLCEFKATPLVFPEMYCYSVFYRDTQEHLGWISYDPKVSNDYKAELPSGQSRKFDTVLRSVYFLTVANLYWESQRDGIIPQIKRM